MKILYFFLGELGELGGSITLNPSLPPITDH